MKDRDVNPSYRENPYFTYKPIYWIFVILRPRVSAP